MNKPSANVTEAAVLSKSDRIVLITYHLLVTVVGAIGSLCIFIGILSSKRNRNNLSNYYLITLAISDILTCLATSPYYLSSLISEKLLPPSSGLQTWCRGVIFVNYCLAFTTILTMAAMSLDRYCAIQRPFVYITYVTKKAMIGLNSFIWIQAVSTCLPSIFMNNWVRYYRHPGAPCGFHWEAIDTIYVVFIAIFNFGIPALVILFTNIVVFAVAKSQHIRTRRKVMVRLRSIKCTKYDVQKGQLNSAVLNNAFPIESFPTVTSVSNAPISVSSKSFSQDHLDFDPPTEEVDNDFPSCESVIKNVDTDDVTDSCEKSFSLKASYKISSLASAPSAIADHSRSECEIAIGNTRAQKASQVKSKASNTEKKHQELKIATMTLLLVISFFVTWVPFAFSRILILNGVSISDKAVVYTSACTSLCSLLNPCLVLATRKEIRKVVLHKCMKNQAAYKH